MMLIIKSVRVKLTLWYIVATSVLLLLVGIVVFLSLKTIFINNLDKTLYNGGKIVEKAVSECALRDPDDPYSLYASGEGYFVENLDEETREIFFLDTVYLQLLKFPQTGEDTYTVLAKTTSLDHRLLPLSPNAYQAVMRHTSFSETIPRLFPFPARMMTLVIYDGEKRPYILQLALSMQHIDDILQDMLFVFSFVFPLVLIVIAGTGYVFMKQAFSPIRQMVAITRDITSEDLSLRLDSIDSHDEIGELAGTLNAMIERLEQSFQQITQFSGDVSHELKTPLAQLKCNAEIALRKPRTSEEYQQTLRSVIEDTEQLWTIIEDLLFLTRTDAKNWSASFTPVELHEIVLEVFETMHGLAQQKHLTVRFDEMDTAEISGDSSLLKRMFLNLLSNAIHYTPSGGVITLALHQAAAETVVMISDTGIGIPEDALPHIFDRLYRVDPSRSHETGGSGLGLAIVRNIITLHHGKISVTSTLGHGTEFRVSFPSIR